MLLRHRPFLIICFCSEAPAQEMASTSHFMRTASAPSSLIFSAPALSSTCSGVRAPHSTCRPGIIRAVRAMTSWAMVQSYFPVRSSHLASRSSACFRRAGCNSLFEVYKHEGSTFQVYIDKAFIEVKGTCFHIKQTDAEKNEITLFRGKIEFNVESTGQKTVMKPLQRVIYNPRNAEMRVEQITNIKWENGKYNFTDIPLQELISIINQMYNSDVTLAKGINHESAFTGSIRYDEPLEDVVNKICFTLNLNKEEHANKIIIKK